MTREAREYTRALASEAQRLLDTLPEGDVLGRRSLESQRDALLSELAEAEAE